MEKPRAANFDPSSYAWKKDVDYRAHPERYRVGKGEQGVLICEPYKSEILAHWRFKTPEIARASSKTIYRMFLAYLRQGDFVGADMARKFRDFSLISTSVQVDQIRRSPKKSRPVQSQRLALLSKFAGNAENCNQQTTVQIVTSNRRWGSARSLDLYLSRLKWDSGVMPRVER